MNKSLKIIIPLAILLAVIMPFIMTARNTMSFENKIYPGVSIRNIAVAGMTKEEAKKAVNDVLKREIESMELKLFYKDKSFVVSSEELKASYDVDKAVENAFAYGKSGNIISKTINIWNLKKQGYTVPLTFSADTQNVINDLISRITSELNTGPADAKIAYAGNGKFIITPEKDGVTVDAEKLKALISNSVDPVGGFKEIEIPVSIEPAKLTAATLSGIKEKISGFTTSFNSGDVNRSGNISLAARTITGTILFPGEIFSMNSALGPRTASTGYKEAPIILNGVLKPGLAGGICQATTTVYNTALLANLRIVERHQHTLKSAYVDASRDATISGSSLDMKFKNTTSAPIYIEAFTGTSTLTVNFYGTIDHPEQTVKIVSEVLYTIAASTDYIYDSTLEQGKQIWVQKPAKGMKSRAYREVYENGVRISRDLLSVDLYNPLTGKLRIGTKVIEPVASNQ